MIQERDGHAQRRTRTAALLAAIISGAMAVCCARTVQDLNGRWVLSGDDERGKPIRCAISVPGGIYSALLEANAIPDPYWRLNEAKVQWPRRKEWVVEREFDVDAALLACESVILRIEDADTFVRISVNGSVVGECSNRFRRWDFDVKRFLRPGRNHITGVFRSAEVESEKLAARYPEKYTCQNVKVRNMPLIRKPQCHAGWDWGITLMDAGFCGDVRLIGDNIARIDYAFCDQRFAPDFGKCEVAVHVEAFSPKGGETTLAASVGEFSAAERRVRLAPGVNRLSASVVVDRPSLWWPAGQGDQFLYPLKVSLGGDTFERKIGLRTVELVTDQDRDPVTGRPASSFFFRINGRDVYCKGCNWIPCDALEDRQTPERYRDLLESAASANMNMVRVWGGGRFEKDCFYDLCDELGLMIWHDFMFACGTYPTDGAFMENVREELTHQIKRLRDRPSIVLWSGDNECYGVVAWDCFPEINDSTRGLYFSKIAERAAHNGALVKALDPDRPWWPSSPGSSHGGYTDDFADFEKGDNHFWGIWFRNQPFETLYGRRPRFTDEFGYQSFPSVATALTFARREDLNFTSPVMDAHQKSRTKDGGRTLNILHGMAREFRLPESPEDMFWLSQTLQCEALLPGLRYWRALRPYCMGMCVWQLNDNWPVISWSAIEYGGRWKQLMYVLKRSYAPVVVVPFSTDGGETVDVRAVNDLPRKAHVDVDVVTLAFDGGEVDRKRYSMTLPPASSLPVARLPVMEFGSHDERAKRFVTVDCAVADGSVRSRGRADWFFEKFRDCPLEMPEIKMDVHDENGVWTVAVRTDRPAFYVWVESTVRGEFDDNAFTLLPGEERVLRFAPKDRASSFSDFRKGVSVRHLRKTYR